MYDHIIKIFLSAYDDNLIKDVDKINQLMRFTIASRHVIHTDIYIQRSARPSIQYTITRTRLYNFDPLKPHFYIVKLGFTGVYIIFLISAQNIDCGYSLEPPTRGGSNEYPQCLF